MVRATETGNETAALAAMTIASLLQHRGAAFGTPIDVGDADVLPALHKALGSALQMASDLNRARLLGFELAVDLNIQDFGNACPCGEGVSREGEAAERPLTVVPFRPEDVRAA